VKFHYLCLNDQVGLADEAKVVDTYEGPEDFDEGKPFHAVAFLTWWCARYDMDLKDFEYQVHFWDGRTMVAALADESVSMMTFVFESA
jgi:hypothetical protein